MVRCALLLLAALLAACGPSMTPTPTRPPAMPSPRVTAGPTLAPPTLPPTWTPTATYTPRPPTATLTLTPTPTPLDTAQLCAGFTVRVAPDPNTVMTRDAPAYFVWSDVPRGVHVRLVLTRAREFKVLRADVLDYRNNGILIPMQTVPFSGLIDWQLLVIYEGQVQCRREGEMQKATPALAEFLAALTPTPAPTATPVSTETPTPEAETPITATTTPFTAGAGAGDATAPATADGASDTPTPAR